MKTIKNILKIRNPETGAFEALPGVVSGGNSLGTSQVVNLIYPVGSIYMSVNEANPATLFGGTWEQIKDTFLLSAGDTYAAGETGGEAEHVLTVDEMPAHTHKMRVYSASGSSNWALSQTSQTMQNQEYASSTGGDHPHNNMPPYLTVYVWKRTA